MIDSYENIPSLPLFLKSHSQVQNHYNYNTEIIIIQYKKIFMDSRQILQSRFGSFCLSDYNLGITQFIDSKHERSAMIEYVLFSVITINSA